MIPSLFKDNALSLLSSPQQSHRHFSSGSMGSHWNFVQVFIVRFLLTSGVQ